jgi:hypothetical protein
MFKSKTHPGRAMVLCVAGVNSDAAPPTIRQLLAPMADGLEIEVGAVNISSILWNFRCRTMLVAELPYRRDDMFAVTASHVSAFSELNALKALAAVDCDLLAPIVDIQMGANAPSRLPPERWSTAGTQTR